MAISVPLKVRTFFRPRLGKRSRSDNLQPEAGMKKRVQPWMPGDGVTAKDNDVAVCDEEVNPINPQINSSFFQKLPLEIRRMIYGYVWSHPHDHMFHKPSGRHIHFQEGRWYNVRCVMNKMDEDLDFIQKRMDEIYDPSNNVDNHNLELWQRRSSQTWGHRHWRCEERMRHPREPRVDKRNFASMMLVCKQMYVNQPLTRPTW